MTTSGGAGVARSAAARCRSASSGAGASSTRPLGVRAYWFLVLVGAIPPLGFLVGLYQTFFFITANLMHGANHLSPADQYSELKLVLAGVLQLSIVSVGAAAFGWSVIPRIAWRDSQT
jgi:hypothetical protein